MICEEDISINSCEKATKTKLNQLVVFSFAPVLLKILTKLTQYLSYLF